MRSLLGDGPSTSPIGQLLGYEPTEFAGALEALAEGTTRYPEIVTGTVDVAGVPQAFNDLGNPEAHAKILVEP